MRRAGRKKRRLVSQPRDRRWWKVLYTLFTVMALLAVCQAGYQALLDSPYFQLKEIRVIGLSPAFAQEIQDRVRQELGEDTSTLAVPISRIRESLLKHPKLSAVNIEVAYPSSLIVTGNERTPSAIVATDHVFYLVARDGVVLSTVRPTELRNHPLPYITGIPSERLQIGQKVPSAGLSRALEMLELLRERNAELYSRFSEVHVHEDPITEFENVTARLRGGVEVFFGSTNPTEKLPLLDLFIQQRIKEGRDPFAVAYVDLRVPGQIICLDKMAVGKARLGEPDQPLGKLPSADLSESQSPEIAKDQQKLSPLATRRTTERDKNRDENFKKSSQKLKEENLGSDEATINASEQANQMSPAEEGDRPRRLRLPFKFFTKRSRDAEDAPVLRPPVDAEPSE
ncbi:MAG: hypothetical protein N2Z21_08950 [Candidatus Sumerlaeaceae bacterium]|nr:hypothetical protein [Candidatus Sumerlaeaceae bacterium]